MVQLDRKLNPRVLAWAIDESGFTRSEIAGHLDVDETLVSRWLQGNEQPSRGQFTKLAQKIKRPKFVFFLDEVPEDLSLSAYHRMPGPSGASVSLNPYERLVVRRARYLQVLLSDLVATSENPAVQFPDLTNTTIVGAGTELREWLNRFRDVDGTSSIGRGMEFAGWRSTVQRAGIFVFALRVREPEGYRTNLRGFALEDQFAPVICVISKDVPRARTFTLFHEIAHLGRRSTSSCHVPSPDNENIEQWCDRVANHALIDRTVLEETIGQGEVNIETVKRVSSRFKVSLRAAALAIQDATSTNGGLYRRVDTTLPWRDIPATSGGGGIPRPEFRINELGSLAVSTVIHAFNQRRIGEAQVRRLLRLDGPDLEAAATDVGVSLAW